MQDISELIFQTNVRWKTWKDRKVILSKYIGVATAKAPLIVKLEFYKDLQEPKKYESWVFSHVPWFEWGLAFI